MEANDIQIGGKHYQREYQHWDMVLDLNLNYLLGCATKYVSRWKDKNGLEDLKKSLHYISKAVERDLNIREYTETQHNKLDVFCDQLGAAESTAVKLICFGSFDEATKVINEMIEEVECGPTSEYVDPDKAYWRG